MSKAVLSGEDDPTNSTKLDELERCICLLEDAGWMCRHLPLYWVRRGRPSRERGVSIITESREVSND